MIANQAQQEAITSEASHILCMAGAGTGKTFTMLKRIEHLIETGVDPFKILVLTFTNAAALNMESRFNTISIKPSFYTFHSFCYNLILIDNDIRKKLGYSTIPQVIDEISYKNLCKSALYNLKLKSSIKSLTGSIPPKELNKRKEYDTFHKYINRTLISQNLITFDYMIQSIVNLFKSDDECIQKYLEQYEYIFVDEFQDTDKLQWDFVQLFPNIFLVGDILQNIYSWRGTDSSIMKNLVDDSAYQIIKLSENYRSTIEICDFANNINNSPYNIQLRSERNGDPVMIFPSEEFKQFILNHIPSTNETTAILCRTNMMVDYVKTSFKEIGIICNTSQPNTEILKKCILSDTDLLKYLISQMSNISYFEYQRNILLRPHIPPIVECIQYIIKNYVNNDTQEFVDKVFQVRLELAENPNKTIDNVIEVAKLNVTDPNIYIGTIHSAKGLEYDNVILPDINSDSFKIQSEESKNLYYVGATRAKNSLKIYETHKNHTL